MDNVLSCIQPTSEMHFGNYFGAVKTWVRLQEEYNCIYGVVDYHAMTMPYSPANLSSNTKKMYGDLMACGLDTSKSVLFIQSLVPEHVELCWILRCYCSFGELSRMTQFKEKSEQQSDDSDTPSSAFVSSGLFFYPVLQAADILIYRPKYVPVGKDQEQHLELSRNIASRFNNRHGEFFPEPKTLLTETPKLMSLSDPTKKMSKSLGVSHYVGLFESAANIRRKVKAAVTDSGDTVPGAEMSPGVSNLFTILKACDKRQEFDLLYEKWQRGNIRYSELKDAVSDALTELASEFVAKRRDIDDAVLERLMRETSEKARAMASATIREVRALTGLIARA